MTLIGSGIENGSFGDNSTAMLQVDRFFYSIQAFSDPALLAPWEEE
jgi:hypothetical protein